MSDWSKPEVSRGQSPMMLNARAALPVSLRANADVDGEAPPLRDFPAGELLTPRCAVCARVAAPRPFDRHSLGARLVPEFESLPPGWTLLLSDPPQPLCSDRCRRRLGSR